jgi:hypothetical protein
MYKLILLLFSILFFAVYGNSQPAEQYLSIDKNDLPDARIQSARSFTGESLFGYINGGAELYLEYGFSSLWVADIELMGGKYKTEIYRMNGAEEAFGIFSISRYKCLGRPPLSPFTCYNKYQLQVCTGEYYISIINSSGSQTDSLASVTIAESIVGKIKGLSVDLSGYLPGWPEESLNNSAVLARGKLGVMNGSPDWEDYFKGIADYSLVIYPDNEKTILSVKFENHDALTKFTSLHNWRIEDLTYKPEEQTGGEVVRKLSDTHLLIEIM